MLTSTKIRRLSFFIDILIIERTQVFSNLYWIFKKATGFSERYFLGEPFYFEQKSDVFKTVFFYHSALVFRLPITFNKSTILFLTWKKTTAFIPTIYFTTNYSRRICHVFFTIVSIHLYEGLYILFWINLIPSRNSLLIKWILNSIFCENWLNDLICKYLQKFL